MREMLHHLFIHNWPRKLIAVLAAVVIWFLVSHSITVTRTVVNVPIRVLNIPSDKTIEGILPNGLLSKRTTLTLTGRRSTLDAISSNDLEVITDAAGMGDRWTFETNKRNLEALNPDIDLTHDVTSVAPVELTIQLEPLVTEKIPITITEPIGEPPSGYIFLDIWPQRLYQTVSGPERRVAQLKEEGIRLTFNLSRITKQDLEQSEPGVEDEDEVRFFVPESWKRVGIPFGPEDMVSINDPEATYLHIDFLKQEMIPLDTELPVALYFPLSYSLTLNPDTYSLQKEGLITTNNGITVLSTPLFVRNVSRLFLDTVRDRLQLNIVAVPPDLNQQLPWNVQFIDPAALEEAYVQASVAATSTDADEEELRRQLTNEYLRTRFRKYMREFELLREDQRPLAIWAELGAETVTLTDSPPEE